MGIHILLICFLRLTTALQVDEQSDIHVDDMADAPDKCALKAWLALTHTRRGYIYQHTRGILLRFVIDLFLIVVISRNQLTKHRVTLLCYVVHVRYYIHH